MLPRFLLIYAIYHGISGLVLAGLSFFSVQHHPILIQAMACVFLSFSLGFLLSTLSPKRYWPLYLTALVLKGLLILVAIEGALLGWILLWPALAILLHETAWLLVLFCLLRQIYHQWRQPPENTLTLQAAMAKLALQDTEVTLLYFVRHKGCIFCGEALSELSKLMPLLVQKMIRVRVITMSAQSETFMTGQPNMQFYIDPTCETYRAFGLEKGRLHQLFSPRVFWDGFKASLKGYQIGPLEGDGFQMPGAFLVYQQRILSSAQPCLASEVIDIMKLVHQGLSHLEHAP
jgi:hypothetical protein